MNDLRTAAQQALEALGSSLYPQPRQMAAMAALKAALAEPVQEPVAWLHTDPDKPRVKFLEWREDEPGYRGRWIKTPLYAAPPQRKPLSDEQARAVVDAAAEDFHKRGWQGEFLEWSLHFTRAIERAHGIGGSNDSN